MKIPPQVTPLLEGQGFKIAREWYQALQSVLGAIIGLSDGDKGDVTVSGDGANWSIDPGAVTYAKIQDVSGASKLLGRGDSGAGGVEEITLGAGLTMTGTTLSSSGGVADGDKGDITVSGSGATWTIDNDAVSFAKMQNIATDRLIGRDTAGSGDPEEITVGGGVEFTTSGGIQRSALTGDVTAAAGNNATTIANNAVTYAKMQDVSATARIIGRKTAGSGDPEELTISETLDLIGSAAQGDILYRGASGWARLAAGTSGHFLKTNGAAADPAWVAGSAGGSGMVLAATPVVVSGAAVTSVTFTGLDLDSHSQYVLRYGIKNATGSGAALSLFFNSDTTATNYNRQRITGNGATLNSARVNDAVFSAMTASSYVSGIAEILKPAGADVTRSQSRFAQGSSAAIQLDLYSHTWTSANNPTSITVTSSVASSIDIDSFFELWRVTP